VVRGVRDGSDGVVIWCVVDRRRADDEGEEQDWLLREWNSACSAGERDKEEVNKGVGFKWTFGVRMSTVRCFNELANVSQAVVIHTPYSVMISFKDSIRLGGLRRAMFTVAILVTVPDLW
jgi:hypothetical protein